MAMLNDVAEQLDPETLEEIRLNIPNLDQIKIHAPARQRVPIGPLYEPLGNTPVVLSNSNLSPDQTSQGWNAVVENYEAAAVPFRPSLPKKPIR